MGFRMLITTMATVFALSACDQLSGKHEIVRAGSQTFLLNRSTGDAKLIDGTSLVAMKPQEPAVLIEPSKKAKTWPDQSINDLKEVKFKLSTKFRDGAMLWKIEASPFVGELEQAHKVQAGGLLQPTVMFELYDLEGFKTGEAIELKIRGGSRTVNSKNEVIELNWSGTQPMTPDTYQSAAFVSTRWYGFNKE